MRVIGIDLGFTGRNPTGVAVLEFAGHEPVLEYTALSATKDSRGKWRWHDNLNIVADLLREVCWTYPPDVMGYEQPHVGKNPQTAIKLALVGGLVIGNANRFKASWVEVQPTQAKQALTGDERADKEAMVKMAAHLFGLPEDLDSHIADAIGIAFHAEAVQRRLQLTRNNQ